MLSDLQHVVCCECNSRAIGSITLRWDFGCQSHEGGLAASPDDNTATIVTPSALALTVH
jgi:hypothetical protein